MWAGQLTAAITHPLPDAYEEPFSLFMKRNIIVVNKKKKEVVKLLGWEYCGEYIAVDDGIEMYAKLKTQRGRDFVIQNYRKGLGSPNSWVHDSISWHRAKIKECLTSEPESGEAEELKSLGLDNDQLNDAEFIEKAVYWQGFLEHYSIKFVRYDEKMYDFMKDGLTTKNKNGKERKGGEPPAKASDWYAVLDQRTG